MNYTINNVNDIQNDTCISYRIQPNPNEINNQLWRFLQAPQDVQLLKNFITKRVMIGIATFILFLPIFS